jgi:hypothetical protein
LKGSPTYRGFPAWFSKAAQAVSRAKGDDTLRPDAPMLIIDLLPLWIDGRMLKDDTGCMVATVSPELPDDIASSYAHIFAASVDLLDIIDFTSWKELAEMRRNYDEALEFNKHENLPAGVSILGDNPPIIPDRLEQLRKLVARAKGKNYEPWD